MKKFSVCLLAIFLSACSALNPQPTGVPPSGNPTATSAPVVAPTKSSGTAQPTSASISVLNVQRVTQADGTINTTANVSTQDNLGVGQVDLASPGTMYLGDSAAVRLRLSPAQQLVSLTPVAVPVKTPDAPSYVYRYTSNIQLYPLMYAQLRAANFEIDQKAPASRTLEAGKTAEWVWIVKPLAAGKQDLLIELSIPIIANDVAAQLSTNVLQNLTLTINVQPPAPTATPPLSQRITDSIVNNAGGIIVALIGILGTLIGAMLAWLNRNKKERK